MLDNRLKKCIEMVSGEGIVCDIGTDHAYLAAELIASGKCRKVIASDVKEGPLMAAAKTIEKYGFNNEIELILSDGLDKIPSEGVSDIVIAGMGGETIVEILRKCQWIRRDINLVLQPMSKPEILRKWLSENGYVINRECAVMDGDKVYLVMSVPYWNEDGVRMSEFNSIRGFIDETDPAGRRYIENQQKALLKKADALESVGKHSSSVHFRTMAKKLLVSEFQSVSIEEIYIFLDTIYPFKSQEKWDNSGLLINSGRNVNTVLLTLDIDNSAVLEAEDYGAELIISHHPVIFEPLKFIEFNNPVYKLIENNISAICMHTNVDKAICGTNAVILHRLSENFDFAEQPELFEKCNDGLGIGYVCELKESISVDEFGKKLKEIFSCEIVRYNNGSDIIKHFAFCSGSGGSMLSEAIKLGCDAYITGDVKHDVWIEAKNYGVSVFDCGHFHTENIVLEELRCVLEEHFPQLEVIIAETSSDPVSYIY